MCADIVGIDKFWAIVATNTSHYDDGSNEEERTISKNNHYWYVLGETCRLGNVQSMH